MGDFSKRLTILIRFLGCSKKIFEIFLASAILLVLFLFSNPGLALADCNISFGYAECAGGSILTCDMIGGCSVSRGPVGWGQCGCSPALFCNWVEVWCGDTCACGGGGSSSKIYISLNTANACTGSPVSYSLTTHDTSCYETAAIIWRPSVSGGSCTTNSWWDSQGGSCQQVAFNYGNGCEPNTQVGTFVPNRPGTWSVVGAVEPAEGAGLGSEANVLLTVVDCPPSCSITIPDRNFSGIGEVQTAFVQVDNQVGTMTQVDFSSGDTAIATVTTPDNVPPTFQTTITSVSPGTAAVPDTTYTATATVTNLAGSAQCVDTADITVTNSDPWCQFKEGNVVAQGNINCPVPPNCILPDCDPSLIKYDVGDYPGIAIAGGVVTTGSGSVSTPIPPFGWKAEGITSSLGIDYAALRSKIPSNVVPTALGQTVTQANLTAGGTEYPTGSGYYYYEYDGALGNLDIGTGFDINLGTRKVVVFVAGAVDTNIRSKIRSTPGQGLFLLIASGNVLVDPSVGDTAVASPDPDLEGLFYAEDEFSTGSVGTDNDLQLHVKGSIVGKNKVNLQRKLPSNSTAPGDYVEKAHDKIVIFPKSLGSRNIRWTEVAP